MMRPPTHQTKDGSVAVIVQVSCPVVLGDEAQSRAHALGAKVLAE